MEVPWNSTEPYYCTNYTSLQVYGRLHIYPATLRKNTLPAPAVVKSRKSSGLASISNDELECAKRVGERIGVEGFGIHKWEKGLEIVDLI